MIGGWLRLLRAAPAALLVLGVAADSSPLSAQTDALDRAPSRFAILDGNRIHFKSLGTGPQAVVLVHGWACDLTVWRHQVEVLAGRTRVVLLDLPGHGRSGKPDTTYSMAFFARAVDAVLRTAGVERGALVGHSMGVPVVREYLRLYPAGTVALVAVDGPLRAPDSESSRRMLAAVEGPDWRQVLEQRVTEMYGAPEQAGLRRTILQMAAATPQHAAVASMRGMLEPAIWRGDQIAVPLLVVVAKGPNWPASYRAYVERLAPGVRYEELEGVQHFLMLERPEVFNPILIRFLSTLQVVR